ncbi:lipid asymmetry maintenance protein MlaB [Polynucleobacter sp. AP-Latsch-80-C2]|jgi:phospholipid transport system transporter-binding protein|uniref:STAS domain-containing protein n=1 Tax=Polynucleobacter sp. AP-Latsch-80-C2 TaxID=2576931 RepID=UPI001C0D1BC5|nr:STAS domain-containing protein [Polynucleobacter sp. AP-Latsch-80-C2]MBU3622582.1 STAS domain-containing protein [Polynucleobacter sp. AP-Latsch-80-C2]
MPFFLPQVVTQENALQIQQEGLSNLATLTYIDCSSLKDFDSTVLTVLLSWQKTLQAQGQSISVVHAPEKLKVLSGVYGVSALLGL